MKNKTKSLILILVIMALVVGLGSVFVSTNMDWFNSLSKPNEWIPNFVIPLVWTIIYILATIILIKELYRKDKVSNVWLWLSNGILNVLWCLIFFTFHLTFLGLITIILNLVFAVVLYEKIKKTSWIDYIFIIYPTWVTIATFLNACLWILN